MCYLMKVKNPQDYWSQFEQSSSWNFCINKKKIIENRDSFLEKFILLGLKYGIIIPNIDINNDILKEVRLLRNNILIDPTINYRDFFYRPFVDINTNKISIKTDLYINSGKDISMLRFQNYSNHFDLFDIQIIDKFRLFLYTDAFFSVLDNTISNKELAYLNTTRFNSYIKKLLKLMLQYDSIFDFENGFEDIKKMNQSKYFKNVYLLVDNEVLFYEDIYDLLPEEHKYKPFEEIQVELDDTNYKIYMENRNEK